MQSIHRRLLHRQLIHRMGLVLVAGTVVAGAVVASRSAAGRQDELPPLVEAPAEAPIELVALQPFRLDRPGVHTMRAERPGYDQGHLLVLRADPDRWRLRQTYDNVLYVGAETARRVNVGDRSGYLVVVVPGALAPDAPIFLGDPELPERVTAEEAARQAAAARSAGVASPGDFDRVVPAEPLFAADEADLLVHASFLVERYAPDEVDLIRGLRAPRLRR